MIALNNGSYILNIQEYNKTIPSINFDLNKNYSKNNKALLIDFKNDYKYTIKCIKKLISLEENNVCFESIYNDLKIKYIIINYNDDIIKALEAINITDFYKKYLFIYDYVFSSLDKKWKDINPCQFCNNHCIATRNHKYIQQEDGCCYSFEYTNSLFSTSLIKNKQKCKYLNKNKQCDTQNLSCKFFACNYLKKYKHFNPNIKDSLLIQSFFNKKQELIIKYNYFHSKEEIIQKLLEKNKTPFVLYYLKSYYRI